MRWCRAAAPTCCSDAAKKEDSSAACGNRPWSSSEIAERAEASLSSLVGTGVVELEVVGEQTHLLTHRKFRITIARARMSGEPVASGGAYDRFAWQKASRAGRARYVFACEENSSSLPRVAVNPRCALIGLGAALLLSIASGRARAGTPPVGADATPGAIEPAKPSDRDSARQDLVAFTRPRRYLNLFGSVMLGDGLRFNNPYRLPHDLGERGASVSTTAPYVDLAVAATTGKPDGVQHGARLAWSDPGQRRSAAGDHAGVPRARSASRRPGRFTGGPAFRSWPSRTSTRAPSSRWAARGSRAQGSAPPSRWSATRSTAQAHATPAPRSTPCYLRSSASSSTTRCSLETPRPCRERAGSPPRRRHGARGRFRSRCDRWATSAAAARRPMTSIRPRSSTSRRASIAYRCQDCDLRGRRCDSACNDPPATTLPADCRPLVHDGEVCLRALLHASCGDYESYVSEKRSDGSHRMPVLPAPIVSCARPNHPPRREPLCEMDLAVSRSRRRSGAAESTSGSSAHRPATTRTTARFARRRRSVGGSAPRRWYLQCRPDGAFRDEVAAWFERAEPLFFEATSGSASGMQAYLDALPGGPTRGKRCSAARLVQRCRARRCGRTTFGQRGGARTPPRGRGAEPRGRHDRVRDVGRTAARFRRLGPHARRRQGRDFAPAWGGDPRPKCAKDRCTKLYELPYELEVRGKPRAVPRRSRGVVPPRERARRRGEPSPGRISSRGSPKRTRPNRSRRPKPGGRAP